MNGNQIKTVKEIFKDYDSNSFALNAATIKNIQLFKKTNQFDMILQTEEKILIKDLMKFDNYLEKRFSLSNVIISIEYTKEVQINIEEEWEDIIQYMSFKHPLTKALLKNSNVSIEENKILVKLAMKSKSVLMARKFDQILSNIIYSLFQKKYQVY